MAQQNAVRGVAVDSDARRKVDPVSVVVWPSGMEQDADTWTDFNNYVSAGAAVKGGYPAGPEIQLNPDADPAPGNEPPAEQRPAPAAQRPTPAAQPASPSSSSS